MNLSMQKTTLFEDIMHCSANLCRGLHDCYTSFSQGLNFVLGSTLTAGYNGCTIIWGKRSLRYVQCGKDFNNISVDRQATQCKIQLDLNRFFDKWATNISPPIKTYIISPTQALARWEKNRIAWAAPGTHSCKQLLNYINLLTL